MRPPLLDEKSWRAHADEVARLRGAVCFNVLANHYGVRSSRALEGRVAGRELADGEEPSGIFRRWWRYGRAPSDETIADIRTKTDGAVSLDTWRDLPLYELLAREPPSIARLQQMRESMPPRVRSILFEDGRATADRWIHLRLERADHLKLRAQGTLSAFMTLLSLSREGEILGHDPSHFLPAACAFDMLPYVLLATPPLLPEWPRLYACLDRVFFQRVYADGMYWLFESTVIGEALHSLPGNPDYQWPLMAGRSA